MTRAESRRRFRAVNAVCRELWHPLGLAIPCVMYASKVRTEPKELWLPALGFWVREDGQWISTDVRSHFLAFRPSWIQRMRVRQAVRAYWRASL